MTKQQKRMMILAMITAFIAAGMFLPWLVGAGDLEPPAAPDDPGTEFSDLRFPCSFPFFIALSGLLDYRGKCLSLPLAFLPLPTYNRFKSFLN